MSKQLYRWTGGRRVLFSLLGVALVLPFTLPCGGSAWTSLLRWQLVGGIVWGGVVWGYVCYCTRDNIPIQKYPLIYEKIFLYKAADIFVGYFCKCGYFCKDILLSDIITCTLPDKKISYFTRKNLQKLDKKDESTSSGGSKNAWGKLW